MRSWPVFLVISHADSRKLNHNFGHPITRSKNATGTRVQKYPKMPSLVQKPSWTNFVNLTRIQYTAMLTVTVSCHAQWCQHCTALMDMALLCSRHWSKYLSTNHALIIAVTSLSITTNHASIRVWRLFSFGHWLSTLNSATKHDRRCILCVLNYLPCATAFVDSIFTRMSHQIGTHFKLTSNIPCPWNLNSLLIWGQFYTKPNTWFSKKTSVKSQDMIAEIGRSKN